MIHRTRIAHYLVAEKSWHDRILYFMVKKNAKMEGNRKESITLAEFQIGMLNTKLLQLIVDIIQLFLNIFPITPTGSL